MFRLPTALVLVIACGDTQGDNGPIVPTAPAEQYGFVTTLGVDTVAAEHVTRSEDALIIESVDRWPFVRLRHTEFAIAPDQRLTRMVMEIRTPNAATPAARWRTVRARFDDDSAYVTIEDSGGVTGRTFATAGALTVPHVSMLYGVIEFEIAAAMRRATASSQAPSDTIIFRQFYPDRDVGPAFVLHRGRVIPREAGRVELRHDWLAGTGDVTVDSTGRMLSYSGDRTTYKVAVVRTAEPPDVGAIVTALLRAERASGPAQLSVRDTARATIGTAAIAVDYGRPAARGRVLLGNVIEFGRVWRTGANEATQLTTSGNIMVGDIRLAAGSYTLWTLPTESGVQLVVNGETGQWGTSYDSSRDIGATSMERTATADTTERFTISVVPDGATRGTLRLAWGTWAWTVPIVQSVP